MITSFYVFFGKWLLFNKTKYTHPNANNSDLMRIRASFTK